MKSPGTAAPNGARRLAWAIFALGVLALVADPMRMKTTHALHVLTPGENPMGEGTFAPGAAYPATDPQRLPPGLETRGSWLGSDQFQGAQVTAWFQARPRVIVMLAGYPALAPNRLALDVRLQGGATMSIPYSGENPGESWRAWMVDLPAGAAAVRVRGEDRISTQRGWLAFSEPFRRYPVLTTVIPLAKLALTACLAFTLIYGPGLIWLLSRPTAPGAMSTALLAGPLSLAGLGLLCWGLGGWIAPALVARAGIGALLAAMALLGWKAGRAGGHTLSRGASLVVAVGALLSGFAIAKANLSYAQAGELYADTVSRTLEVGGHSDSRISFHVVQLVANHLAPFSPRAGAYFGPYSFASRGPLAGLMASPIVLAAGSAVPSGKPDQPWQPFDPQGFATYRIALITLASLAGWAVFGVTAALAGTEWALLACATAFLAPFFSHELFFTWPKLFAAACTLVSFGLLRERRPLAAGLALGAGYLFHPLAVLSAPFLSLWILGGQSGSGWRARCGLWARFLCGTAIPIIPWLAVGRLDPENSSPQVGFANYLLMANGGPTDATGWMGSRWQSALNTFVPFRLWILDPAQRDLTTVAGPPDRWVHFGYLYWSTFPFALGLPAFILVVPVLLAGLRRAPGPVFAAVFGPACLLVIYWGAGNTGLMRYCGHFLFLWSIVTAIWLTAQPGAGWCRWAAVALAHPLCLALRGLDVAWMGFGSTLHRHFPSLHDWYGMNDWISLATAIGCLAAATALLARFLRRITFPP